MDQYTQCSIESLNISQEEYNIYKKVSMRIRAAMEASCKDGRIDQRSCTNTGMSTLSTKPFQTGTNYVETCNKLKGKNPPLSFDKKEDSFQPIHPQQKKHRSLAQRYQSSPTSLQGVDKIIHSSAQSTTSVHAQTDRKQVIATSTSSAYPKPDREGAIQSVEKEGLTTITCSGTDMQSNLLSLSQDPPSSSQEFDNMDHLLQDCVNSQALDDELNYNKNTFENVIEDSIHTQPIQEDISEEHVWDTRLDKQHIRPVLPDMKSEKSFKLDDGTYESIKVSENMRQIVSHTAVRKSFQLTAKEKPAKKQKCSRSSTSNKTESIPLTDSFGLAIAGAGYAKDPNISLYDYTQPYKRWLCFPLRFQENKTLAPLCVLAKRIRNPPYYKFYKQCVINTENQYDYVTRPEEIMSVPCGTIFILGPQAVLHVNISFPAPPLCHCLQFSLFLCFRGVPYHI